MNHENRIPKNLDVHLKLDKCNLVSNIQDVEYPYTLKVQIVIDDIMICETEGLVKKDIKTEKYFLNFSHAYTMNNKKYSRFEFSSGVFKTVLDSFNRMMMMGKKEGTYAIVNNTIIAIQKNKNEIANALTSLEEPEENEELKYISKDVKVERLEFGR